MMPSNDFPNQYKLQGENTPIWFVLGMLLLGTIGSVTTTRLLLPEQTLQTLETWVIQATAKGHAEKPLSPGADTNTVSIVTDPQNLEPEAASPVDEESLSRQKIDEEGHAVTSIPSPFPSTMDRPVTAMPKQKVLVVDESFIGKDHELSLISPDTDVESLSQLSDEEIAEQTKVESVAPRVVEITEVDQESSPIHAASPATSAETDVDSAANKVIETTAGEQDQLAENKLRDCVPLFFVQFKHGSIDLIDLDLNDKATRLREWLNLHPDIKVIIEGHTDSSGPEEFNLLISHRRAKAVTELLANAGVTSKQMVTHAFGEYTPLIGLPPESERNRRVSLRVEGAFPCPEPTSDGEIR